MRAFLQSIFLILLATPSAFGQYSLSDSMNRSIAISEEGLVTAHNVLDACCEMFYAIPGFGAVAAGASKGVLNAALPSDEGLTRKVIEANHKVLLGKLSTIDSKIDSIATSIEGVQQSVDEINEEQLYIRSRSLYAELVENKATTERLSRGADELIRLVLDAKHMFERKPRSLVFYLTISSASLSLANLRENANLIKDPERIAGLKLTAQRIDEILKACERTGAYSEESRKKLQQKYEQCRSRSLELLAKAGAKPCSDASADKINQFAVTGREPTGKPDVEISLTRSLFGAGRTETYTFKESECLIEVKGPIASVQNGYDFFHPIALTCVKDQVATNSVSRTKISGDDQTTNREPLKSRVVNLVIAYNESVAATNDASRACVIAQSAKKLVEFNSLALTVRAPRAK